MDLFALIFVSHALVNGFPHKRLTKPVVNVILIVFQNLNDLYFVELVQVFDDLFDFEDVLKWEYFIQQL